MYLYPSFIEIMAHSVFLGTVAVLAAKTHDLFGGRKIPELMRGLGGGVKEFKKAMREEDDETPKDDSKKLS